MRLCPDNVETLLRALHMYSALAKINFGKRVITMTVQFVIRESSPLRQAGHPGHVHIAVRGAFPSPIPDLHSFRNQRITRMAM